MAKIFRISGYLIDINDDCDEDKIKAAITNKLDLQSQQLHIDCADITNWKDDNPLNYGNCDLSYCTQYFKNEKINYIVEWWEEDSLDIDNNQHILFSLENEDIDIVITEKNIDEINCILTKFNIDISMEFHVNFFDRIIYPISRYGEKYYEYKYGDAVNKILKFIGVHCLQKRKSL